MGIIGVAARITERQYRIIHWNHLGQLIRQINGDLVGFATKHMTKSQLAHLLGGGINQLLIAIAQSSAPEASQALEIFIALFIPHIAALTPLDGDLLYGFKIGCWIN